MSVVELHNYSNYYTFPEMRSANAADRGCVAAWRGEGNKVQTSVLAVSSPGSYFFPYFKISNGFFLNCD